MKKKQSISWKHKRYFRFCVLQFKSDSKFKQHTQIEGCVYVICVVGNTGEGKSHLLNHTFFGGNEVFRVFPDGEGTQGVHVAFYAEKSLVIVDTEGLLNPRCSSPERQKRMLFKVISFKLNFFSLIFCFYIFSGRDFNHLILICGLKVILALKSLFFFNFLFIFFLAKEILSF